MLDIVSELVQRVIVPPAVVAELDAGRRLGVDLPDLPALRWLEVRAPKAPSGLPTVKGLGQGEAEVLMLGLSAPGTVLIIDDALARTVARSLELPFTGTLGLLLDAKRAGLVPAVSPLLDRLHALRFRLAPSTRTAVLRMAQEE
jgi:hypothetical protein